MNWGECKLLALQKIDPSVTSLTPTRNTKDYLNAIVGAANRGLNDLATAGKYIIKEYTIIQEAPKPTLSTPIGRIYPDNEAVEFTCYCKSYYFELSGNVTATIKVGDSVVKTISNTGKGFTAYKGLITNTENLIVTLTFNTLYPYMYRNVALYDVTFESADDVWEYTPVKRYDLRSLASDFYKLQRTDVVRQDEGHTTDYGWEGDSILVLNGLEFGVWTVHYFAYPSLLTESTLDSYSLALDPEVATLLPVYMASQLLEDDDSSMAYYFLQQYQEAKAKLSATVSVGKAKFVDRNGW